MKLPECSSELFFLSRSIIQKASVLLAYCAAIDSPAHLPAFLLLARSEKSSNGLSFSPRSNLFLRIHWVRSLPPTTKVPLSHCSLPLCNLTSPVWRNPLLGSPILIVKITHKFGFYNHVFGYNYNHQQCHELLASGNHQRPLTVAAIPMEGKQLGFWRLMSYSGFPGPVVSSFLLLMCYLTYNLWLLNLPVSFTISWYSLSEAFKKKSFIFFLKNGRGILCT